LAQNPWRKLGSGSEIADVAFGDDPTVPAHHCGGDPGGISLSADVAESETDKRERFRLMSPKAKQTSESAFG